MAPYDLFGSSRSESIQPKSIYLHNPNTGETVDSIYFEDGRYLPEPLAQINYLFRDHLTGKIRGIDPQLIDLLERIQQITKPEKPLTLLSGYRSKQWNKLLRRHNALVARNSYHIKGKAADIQLQGYKSRDLYVVAKYFKAGGVGYYPGRDFIHVDVGPVRYWRR